jgi:predicted DNA-binding ribbon-helix-helix protein
MVDNKSNIADDVSAGLNKAVHSIYEEHPHECNMIFILNVPCYSYWAPAMNTN